MHGLWVLIAFNGILTSFAADTPDFKSLAEIRAHYGVPGIGYASIEAGAQPALHIQVDGFRKRRAADRLQSTDRFHIGSCTKSMTALLIAQAVGKGLVRYDDTLEKLFPDLKVHPSFKTTTLRDLLVHEAGVGGIDRIDTEFGKPAFWEKIFQNRVGLEKARRWVAKTFLSFPKQTSPTWIYSNPGYMMLGRVLERLYHQPWEQVIREKLFRPLGMTSCGFGPTSNPSDPEGVATSVWGHFLEKEAYNPIHFDNPAVYGPAGTVHCSLADWAKYATLNIDLFNGRSSFIPAALIPGLYAPITSGGDTLGGWAASPGTNLVLGYAGSNRLNYATITLVPARNRAVLVVTNAGDAPAQDATSAAFSLAVDAFETR